jgi:hypothetical protein
MSHHTKDKGDLAVAKVIVDLTEKGYGVYLPISEHTKADLIAENGEVYRIQVKHSIDGFLRNVNGWADKNGSHTSKYKENDFDYYALYLKPLDKIIYAHIKYGGKKIRFTMPKSSGEYFWYEDFLEFKENVEKRKITSDMILTRKGTKRNDKIFWPQKEELEKLVWEKPTAILAEELGVTDSAIGKKCRSLGIIKPSRGYWAKKNSSNNKEEI